MHSSSKELGFQAFGTLNTNTSTSLMSHGCGQSTRENDSERNTSSRRPQIHHDFGQAISKIAVAQICESIGFEGYKDSSLEAFSDIVIRYICDLGKTTNFYANLAGRTNCSLFDIVQGLEDLGGTPGFQGASQIGHCLVGSVKLKEVMDYVSSGDEDELPLAQPVLRFPVIRERNMIPSFVQMGETPTSKHIPAWLPAFPDPHTYKNTPMWNERASDPRSDKIEQARQRRKAERALLSLQQRLIRNDLPETLTWGSLKERTQESQESRCCAIPLQFNEKEVSPPVLLPRRLADDAVSGNHHVSVMEAFAPAIEAVKGGGGSPDDTTDGERIERIERMLLPNKRPSIQFKLRTAKKLLGEFVDISLQKKSEGRTVFCVRDDERDDKKRRAEFILRQCMENPLDLNQL